MKYIGKIDREIYQCVTKDIVTEDVIITEGYSNSIITFMRISDKRWNRYLRTKDILYKKE